MADRYETSLSMPYDADDLCALVADVRAYPHFLPWIKAMRVWDERAEGWGRVFLAEAAVGYKMISERFATSVRHDRAARTVETRLLRGPFRRLENTWRFEPAPGGALVRFEIVYEFSGPILKALLQNNFDKAVGRLIAAFRAEADRRFAAPR